MGTLRRRQFLQSGLALAGVGVLAGCRLLPSTEPSRAKVARLGFLALSGPDAATVRTYTAAFRHGLSELGYVEGQHFTIESRFAEGSVDRLPELATELIGIPVDVLITGGTQVTQAAKQVNDATPIVVPLAADPVGTGLVASLA